jgi:hypothetical protein
MSPPALAALLLTKNTNRKKWRQKVYFTNQNPTELYYQRQELLLREVRETRLARRLRAARQKGRVRTHSGQRTAGILRQAIALWGRASVPFFRA